MTRPRIAIVGAGPAGLMAADVLCQYQVEIHVYEQKPSAARKFLMAGKTGLNISHAEDLPLFLSRYRPSDWLAPYISRYPATWIRQWMQQLGISSYVGSSGRIFPVEMKAAPLLRAWLAHLKAHHVQFFYRHQITQLQENTLTIQSLAEQTTVQHSYDAIILACGAISWPQLGSDGQWQAWFNADDLQAFYASNVGIECAWSAFLTPYFGQALKRVTAWVNDSQTVHGDIVISHYGLESGLIYKLNTDLRQQFQQLGTMNLMLDLLPDETLAHIQQQLQQKNKQSLNSKLKRLGLDVVKIALLRECTDKNRWQDAQYMAQHIKQCTVIAHDFRPIQEAISCAGGVKRNALHDDGFQLKANPKVYCCGEMLDWDAPTGGYLLTACFATGRTVGEQIVQHLNLSQ